MRLGRFINTRPLSVLGIIFAIRGVLYGLGFALATPIAQNTFLWNILLKADINPVVYGFIIIALSIVMCAGFVLDNDRVVRYGGYTSVVAYMLVTAAYLTQFEWIGALTQGLIWVLLTGFVTYAYLNREYVVTHYKFKE